LKTFRLIVAGIAGVVTMGTAMAQASAQSAAEGDWKFRAQIYGWFPGISGETIFPPPSNGGASLGLEASDYLKALHFVFMGGLEARKGRYGLLTDYIYLDFKANRSRSGDFSLTGPGGHLTIPADALADVGLRLRGWSWSAAGTYALIDKPSYELQAVGNVASLPPASLQGAATVKPAVWDAIVGVKGRAQLGQGRWFAPYYIDIGTGESDFTWQAMGGVGYAFDWGEVVGSYRHLDYRFGQSSGMQSLTFSGPAVSFAFRF
jgi:hypothetical protein